MSRILLLAPGMVGCLLSVSFALAPQSALEQGDVRQKLWILEQLTTSRKDPAARQTVVKFLDDQEPPVRGRAARMLGMWKDPSALPQLEALLQDPDPAVSFDAEWALRSIGGPAAGILKKHTYYLTLDEMRRMQQKAKQLEGMVENAWPSAEDPAQVAAWMQERIDILEKLVPAFRYDAVRMEEYHAASRRWEEIRKIKGWNKDQHHFLLLIHTFNRPLALDRLLESVFKELDSFDYGGREAGGWEKVRVLVVDDSNKQDRINANLDAVERARRRGLNVDYWGEKRQKDLIIHLDRENKGLKAESFVAKSGRALRHPDELVFSDKGTGGIRNMARMAALQTLRAMPENTLVVTLDDDTELGKTFLKNGVLANGQFTNFFDIADRAFASDPNAWIVAGGSTLDSLDGREGLEPALERLVTLLEWASKLNPDQAYDHQPIGGMHPSHDGGIATARDALVHFLDAIPDFPFGKYPVLASVYAPEKDLARENEIDKNSKAVSYGSGETFFARIAAGGGWIVRPQVIRSEIPFLSLPRGEDWFFLQWMDLLHPGRIRFNPALSVVHNRSVKERAGLYDEFEKSFQGRLVLGHLSPAMAMNPIPDIPAFVAFVRDGAPFVKERRERVGEARLARDGKGLEEQFARIRNYASRLEKYLDASNKEYWWNQDPALRSGRENLRALVRFLRRFQWDDDSKRKFIQKGRDVFDQQMQAFVRTVEALPDWKRLLDRIEFQSKPVRTQDILPALQSRLHFSGPLSRVNLIDRRLRVYGQGGVLLKIPFKRAKLAGDSMEIPVDFEKDVLPGRLSILRSLKELGAGTMIVQNLELPADRFPFPDAELARIQAVRKGETIVVPWAILQERTGVGLSEELRELALATVLRVDKPSSGEEFKILMEAGQAVEMYDSLDVPLLALLKTQENRKYLPILEKANPDGYRKAMEAVLRIDELFGEFLSMEYDLLRRGISQPNPDILDFSLHPGGYLVISNDQKFQAGLSRLAEGADLDSPEDMVWRQWEEHKRDDSKILNVLSSHLGAYFDAQYPPFSRDEIKKRLELYSAARSAKVSAWKDSSGLEDNLVRILPSAPDMDSMTATQEKLGESA